jgi:hypothetical protein
MTRIPRSRPFAALVLLAFLLAQPVVGCAALCLLERHHAAEHEMSGMDAGAAALASGACHTGITSADHLLPLQVLSAMEPGREPVFAAGRPDSVEPVDAVPALSPPVSPAVEPPPPRFV